MSVKFLICFCGSAKINFGFAGFMAASALLSEVASIPQMLINYMYVEILFLCCF